MAIENIIRQVTIHDYSAYDTTKIPLEGQTRFFDTIEPFIKNEPLSVLGDGVSKVEELPFREMIYIEMGANIDISSLNIKGNIIRVHNTDTSNHTITTGGTPATYTIKPDMPAFFQFDGTDWIELSQMKQFQEGTAASTTDTITNKMTNYFERDTSGANGIIRTMPLAANNTDVEFTFQKVDSGTGAVAIKFTEALDGFAAASDGYYYFILIDQYQFVKVKSNGSTWNIIGGQLIVSTGWVNTNDHTNVHDGTVDVDYDNLSSAFKIGEKVTDDGTNATGIIVKNTGTTLTLWKCTGTGVFSNNNALTGSMGGSALVNEPGGSTKAQDCNIYHGSGLTKEDFVKTFSIYASTTGQDADSVKVGDFVTIGSANTNRNYGFRGVDPSNIQCQTGASSVDMIQADGTVVALTNQDYSYKIKLIHIY